MKLAQHSRTTTVHANVRITRSVFVPGAAALAVRPHPISGQAQTLVVCHLGLCPLQLSENHDYVRLEHPLALRNQISSNFKIQNVHDAAYDSHSGLVLFASGTSIYGMDATNRISQLAGDEEGGFLFDGSVTEARFVGAQRLAPDGQGMTYIRDRDTSSRNGFCLRALFEASLPNGSGGSGARAIVTTHTGGDMGPQAMAYDSGRCSLLFTKRGRALHQLLPYGITQEILGTDEPITLVAADSAAAAAASASAFCSEASDDDDSRNNSNGLVEHAAAVSTSKCAGPFINIQALAADAATGNVYILDGPTGSNTILRVLRPTGSLDTLEEQLQLGPAGNPRLPRLAVLPYGHLAVYGATRHDIMLFKL